jgi:hypothetical protein
MDAAAVDRAAQYLSGLLGRPLALGSARAAAK